MENASRITSFTKLNTWREGHKLVVMVHETLRKYPHEQLFALVSQISRAVISVTSNVAEGFGRISYKEKLQFYYTAQGSLTELQNQLLASRDIGYISSKEFSELAKQTVVVHKLLSGLIKKTKSFIHNS